MGANKNIVRFCVPVRKATINKYCANFQWERLENFRKRQRQEIFRSEVENLAMIYSGRDSFAILFSREKYLKI